MREEWLKTFWATLITTIVCLALAVIAGSFSIGGTFFFVLLKFVIPAIMHENYKSKIQAILNSSGINEIDRMTGLQFEAYLGNLFQKLGYESTVTQGSGDFGADLVISKDGKTIVIQAKRYTGCRN